MRLLEDPQFLKTAAGVCYCVAAVFAVLAIILFFVFDIRGMIRAYREIKEIRRTRKTSDGSKIRQNSKTRKISDRSEIRQNNKIRKTRQSIKGGLDSGQRQKESTDRTMTNKKPEKKVNIILAVILAAALLPAWPLSSAAHTVPCTAISSRGYDGKTLSASKAGPGLASERGKEETSSERTKAGGTSERVKAGDTSERTKAGGTSERPEAEAASETAETGITSETAETGTTSETAEAGTTSEIAETGASSEKAETGDSVKKTDSSETDNFGKKSDSTKTGAPGEIRDSTEKGDSGEKNNSDEKSNFDERSDLGETGNASLEADRDKSPAENDSGNPSENPGESAASETGSTTAETGSTPAESGSTTAETGSTPAGAGSTTAEAVSTPAGAGSTTAEAVSTSAGAGSTTAEEGGRPAGAGSTTAEAEISDEEIPGIEVSMPQPTMVSDWPTWHRADNCAVSVRIKGKGISGYRIRIGDAVEVTSENVEETWLRSDEEGMTITVPSAEVCKNPDGTIRISAQAVNQSGAQTHILNVVGRYMTVERDEEGMITEACFELDTKSPVMGKVQAGLRESGSSALRELTEDDLRYRMDTDAFYFAQESVVLVCGIEEENFDSSLFSARCKKDEKNYEIPDGGAGSPGTFSIAMEDEAEYTEITICGTDKAGNPLLSASGKTDPEAGVQEEENGTGGGSQEGNSTDAAETPLCTAFSEAGEGKISFLHGFIVDRTAPEILIEHGADRNGRAFLYSEKEGDRLLTLYTNFQVSTEVTITDRCGENASLLDGDGISAVAYRGSPDGTVTGQEILGNWSDITSARTFSGSFRPENGEEGHYWFEVFATDRAGNRPVVREVLKKERITDFRESTYSSGGETTENGSAENGSVENGSVESTFTIVCDCTPPELCLTCRTDAAAYLYRSRMRGTPEKEAYMNRSLTAEAEVLQEENYDRNRICFLLDFKEADKIPAGHIPDAAEEADGTEAAALSGSNCERIPMGQWTGRASRTIEADGRAVFSLFGTDKAGNPAVVTEQFLAETEDRSGSNTEDAGPWKASGCGDHYDPHLAFVVDTVAPEAEILYEIGKEDVWLYRETLVETVPGAGGGEGPSVSAYGRGDIRPAVRIREANDLDEERIRISEFRAKVPDALTGSSRALRPASVPSKEGYREVEGIKKLSGDSLYLFYAIAGEDRAGNPVRVTERFSDEKKAKSGKQGGFKGNKVFSGSAAPGGRTGESGSPESTEGQNGTENSGNTGDDWYISRLLLIVDRTAPEVELSYVPEKSDHEIFLYREKLTDKGPEVSSYFNGEIRPSISVKDLNEIDPDRLEIFEYTGTHQLPAKGKKKTLGRTGTDTGKTGVDQVHMVEGLTTLKKDGSMAYFVIRGTDRAGNPIVVTRDAIEGKTKIRKMGHETGSLGASASAAERRTDPQTRSYTSHFLFVIDRTAPRVSLTYRTKEKVYVYSRKRSVNEHEKLLGKPTGNISGVTSGKREETSLYAFVSGTADIRAEVTNRNEHIDLARLYYAVEGPGRETIREKPWTSGSLNPAVTSVLLKRAETEGEYICGIWGEDKAGNAIVVTESIESIDGRIVNRTADPAKNTVKDSGNNLNSGNNTTNNRTQFTRTASDCGKGYSPIYTLVIDRTAPLVTLEYSFSSTDTAAGSSADSAGGGGKKTVTAYVYDENGYDNRSSKENKNGKENKDGLSVYVSGRAEVTLTVEEAYGDPERLFYTRTVEEVSGRETSSRHTIGSFFADIPTGGFFGTENSRTENSRTENYRAGNKGAGIFGAGDIGTGNDKVGKSGTFRRSFCIDSIRKDGRYSYGALGTDCAGNPAVVVEKFAAGTRLNTDHSDKRGGGSVKSTGRGKEYEPFYTIIIDTTAPEYRFSISLPPDPEEAFDGGNGKRITYYGRKSQKILAEYTVRDRNFDGTRILSDYSSLSARKGSSRVDDLEALSPGWTAPGRGQTSLRKEKNLTAAVFSMPVEVRGMNEGMYRFEIAGCDKAGNLLVPSQEQRKADASAALEDRIARTAEHGRGAGQYWSERKAVDVTPPTGVLKVQTGRKASEAYYELRFDVDGDDPVRCEPFRSEREAFVTVESDDQSPTRVSFSLRSQDAARDRAYSGQNPILSSGTGAFGNDNSAQAVVRGEQVFHIENVMIRDRAGNVRVNSPGSAFTLGKSAGIYLDVSAPELSRIGDAEAPQVKIIADGSFTRHEADGERYIYRPEGSTLDLKVSVTDPGGAERSSGLGRVTVKVTVGDRDITDKVTLNKIPYTFSGRKGAGISPDSLVYSIEDAGIRIPAGAFAQSNDITVRVEAQDNSGNRSDTGGSGGGLLRLGIDTVGPKIEVNYTDDVQPRNEKYFSGRRIVQIAVIDRNVSRDRIHIRTNLSVPDSLQPPHENRSGDGNGETGNGDRWTMSLVYDRDGEYTLNVDGSDALGNPAADIVWNGPSPKDFVIDRTKPVFNLFLLNTDVRNGKYYRDVQTVGIRVKEHNFRQEDVQYISSSGSRGRDRRPGDVAAPVFSSSGDVHTGTVSYREDGYYSVRARYVDLAGNIADEAFLEEFVVDRTAPELVLENIPSEGDVFTGPAFCPAASIFDTYPDVKNSVFEAQKAGAQVPVRGICTDQRDNLSLKLQMPEFTVRKAFDGVYYVTAAAQDLAGNRSREQRLRFSVNRFGSSYEAGDIAYGGGNAYGSDSRDYGDDSRASSTTFSSSIRSIGNSNSPTMTYIRRYFNRETKDPLVIREINPSPVEEYSVTMRKDSVQRVLQPGREYKRTVELDEEGKHSYLYEIACPVFEKEGNYSFVISSRDSAGNENSTAQVMQEEAAGGRLSVGLFPIAFCIDRTPPVNRITGIRSDVQFIRGDELEISIFPEDAQTGVESVELRFWKSPFAAGTDAAPEKILKYRYYGEKETPDPVHPDLGLYTGEKGIEIPVHLDGSDQWQILEIITTDPAGNESRDYRAAGSRQVDGKEIRTQDCRRRFLISSDPFVRLRSFRLLFPVIGAAAAFVLILLQRQTGFVPHRT